MISADVPETCVEICKLLGNEKLLDNMNACGFCLEICGKIRHSSRFYLKAKKLNDS